MRFRLELEDFIIMGPFFVYYFVLLVVGGMIVQAGSPSSTTNSSSSHKSSSSKTLGPCQTCRILAASYQNALTRTIEGPSVTMNISSGGQNGSSNSSTGDKPTNNASEPLWGNVTPSEDAKVANTSSRFDQILTSLCSDVKFGKEACSDLAVAQSQLLQEYWSLQTPSLDLFSWLCIDRLRVCCPINHFGPSCTPCSGFPSDICSGHGKCKGNGTRKGNGACACDPGYVGESCSTCDRSYYEAYRDETKLICSPCHRGCDGGCTGAGTKNCAACKEGWESDEDKGCMDINECLMVEMSCTSNQFCVNTEGSYACFDCDRSCAGCIADGPDMCSECAEGFILVDNKICIDGASKARDRKVDVARYLTYFGLCVSTCIIFQKNMAVASIIGIAVGVYIATSEYLLNEVS